MPASAARFLGSIGQAVLALLAGIACGALLVATYIYSSLGEPLMFEGLVVVSLLYGAAIAAICVPIWLVLARHGWDRAPTAAALGFSATAAFLLLTYAAGSHDRLELMVYTFVPYAACGAVAAVVTWWTDRLLRRA